MLENKLLDAKMAQRGYHTVAWYSERTGFDQSTVKKWCHRSLVEFLKVGNRNYLKLDSVVAMLGLEASQELGLVPGAAGS